MLFVFDTNVLISAALGSISCRRAFELAIERGGLVRSEETFTELAVTLEKKRLQKYFTPQDKIDFLANYLAITKRIEVIERFFVCRDHKDNMLLELAWNSKANILITGDKDLLSLHPFRKIPIINPADFVETINKIHQ